MDNCLRFLLDGIGKNRGLVSDIPSTPTSQPKTPDAAIGHRHPDRLKKGLRKDMSLTRVLGGSTMLISGDVTIA